MALDGLPHPLLLGITASELLYTAAGLHCLRRTHRRPVA